MKTLSKSDRNEECSFQDVRRIEILLFPLHLNGLTMPGKTAVNDQLRLVRFFSHSHTAHKFMVIAKQSKAKKK